MSSIYHILDKIPAIYPEDMQIEYEQLAQQLIKSGKLLVFLYGKEIIGNGLSAMNKS